MIFSHYKEICGLILDYLKITWKGIKYYVKKANRNLLHANIDVHSRRLIAEFPIDGVKFISKFQSQFSNMIFSEKVDMIGFPES